MIVNLKFCSSPHFCQARHYAVLHPLFHLTSHVSMGALTYTRIRCYLQCRGIMNRYVSTKICLIESKYVKRAKWSLGENFDISKLGGIWGLTALVNEIISSK